MIKFQGHLTSHVKYSKSNGKWNLENGKSILHGFHVPHAGVLDDFFSILGSISRQRERITKKRSLGHVIDSDLDDSLIISQREEIFVFKSFDKFFGHK